MCFATQELAGIIYTEVSYMGSFMEYMEFQYLSINGISIDSGSTGTVIILYLTL
jgi:hypothetical protein